MKRTASRILPAAFAAILVAGGLSNPAEAGGWRHGHGWGGGPHRSSGYFDFSFYSPPEPFYGPEPVYYNPQPYNPVPQQYNYTQPDDRYCREYNTTARVGDRYQPTYGTACMQPDGSWQIVD